MKAHEYLDEAYNTILKAQDELRKSRRYKKIEVSGSVILAILSSKKEHPTQKAWIEGLPDDAMFIDMAQNYNSPDTIIMFLASKEFDEVPMGEYVPYLELQFYQEDVRDEKDSSD